MSMPAGQKTCSSCGSQLFILLQESVENLFLLFDFYDLFLASYVIGCNPSVY
jgi:hypothetical protein